MVAGRHETAAERSEDEGRWSTLEWSKERKGLGLFLTSTPTPVSASRRSSVFVADSRGLRLMNQGHMESRPGFGSLRTKLATLQRTAAATHGESRKTSSPNNPVVLGFSGPQSVDVRLWGQRSGGVMSRLSTKSPVHEPIPQLHSEMDLATP